MKLQPMDQRIQRFLGRHLGSPAFRWDDVPDPRARRGRRWELGQLLDAALAGLLAGCPTLRDVEGLTDEGGELLRRRVPRRVPDTTLYELFPRLSAAALEAKLRQQVHALWRAKCLEPEGLPCGVLSIDGKGLGALEHDADGTAQKGHRSDGSPYWLARMLRAVLTSSPVQPCLGQMPIGAKTNEMGSFAEFYAILLAAHGAGDLFEIVTVDAGMTSKANATTVHDSQRAYVMALKETQPELLAEARRLLDPRLGTRPDAESPWESYRGGRVRRRLYRTDEIAGYHGWDHLKQAWLVEQVTEDADGKRTVELRYFLTSLRWGRLCAPQILTLVRIHWRIENGCNWTLDVQWHEDSVPWCSSGNAVGTLSWLRLMAYNLLSLARARHLLPRRPDGTRGTPAPWRRIFTWVKHALWLNQLPETAAAVG